LWSFLGANPMNDEIRVTVLRYPDRENLVLAYIDPVSNKRRTKSAGTSNEKDAWKAAAKWEEELRAGKYVSPSKITWKEFRQRYERERLASQSVSARKSTGTAFNLVERVLSPDRLAKLTTATMSKMIAELRAEKMRESTLASYLRHLKAAFRWARRMGMLTAVPEFDMPRSGDAKGRPVTTEEFERMLAKVPKIRPHDTKAWADLLTGLWLSGLRLGEALAVSWDESEPFAVDLSGRFPAFAIEARAQKGRRDERLPMTPDFARWLLDNTAADERHGRVFKMPSLRNGEPISITKVTVAIGRIGKAAGVVVATHDKQVKDKETGKPVTVTVKKFATAHDLRRAFGTRWAKKVMPAVLQRLMRHRAIGTTMKFYVGIEADDVAADLWAKDRAESNILGNNRPSEAQAVQAGQATETQETLGNERH